MKFINISLSKVRLKIRILKENDQFAPFLAKLSMVKIGNVIFQKSISPKSLNEKNWKKL